MGLFAAQVQAQAQTTAPLLEPPQACANVGNANGLTRVSGFFGDSNRPAQDWHVQFDAERSVVKLTWMTHLMGRPVWFVTLPQDLPADGVLETNLYKQLKVDDSASPELEAVGRIALRWTASMPQVMSFRWRLGDQTGLEHNTCLTAKFGAALSAEDAARFGRWGLAETPMRSHPGILIGRAQSGARNQYQLRSIATIHDSVGEPVWLRSQVDLPVGQWPTAATVLNVNYVAGHQNPETTGPVPHEPSVGAGTLTLQSPAQTSAHALKVPVTGTAPYTNSITGQAILWQPPAEAVYQRVDQTDYLELVLDPTTCVDRDIPSRTIIRSGQGLVNLRVLWGKPYCAATLRWNKAAGLRLLWQNGIDGFGGPMEYGAGVNIGQVSVKLTPSAGHYGYEIHNADYSTLPRGQRVLLPYVWVSESTDADSATAPQSSPWAGFNLITGINLQGGSWPLSMANYERCTPVGSGSSQWITATDIPARWKMSGMVIPEENAPGRWLNTLDVEHREVNGAQQWRLSVHMPDASGRPTWLQTQWLTDNGNRTFRGFLRRYTWNSETRMRNAGEPVGVIMVQPSLFTGVVGHPNMGLGMRVRWMINAPGLRNTPSGSGALGCVYPLEDERLDAGRTPANSTYSGVWAGDHSGMHRTQDAMAVFRLGATQLLEHHVLRLWDIEGLPVYFNASKVHSSLDLPAFEAPRPGSLILSADLVTPVGAAHKFCPAQVVHGTTGTAISLGREFNLSSSSLLDTNTGRLDLSLSNSRTKPHPSACAGVASLDSINWTHPPVPENPGPLHTHRQNSYNTYLSRINVTPRICTLHGGQNEACEVTVSFAVAAGYRVRRVNSVTPVVLPGNGVTLPNVGRLTDSVNVKDTYCYQLIDSSGNAVSESSCIVVRNNDEPPPEVSCPRIVAAGQSEPQCEIPEVVVSTGTSIRLRMNATAAATYIKITEDSGCHAPLLLQPGGQLNNIESQPFPACQMPGTYVFSIRTCNMHYQCGSPVTRTLRVTGTFNPPTNVVAVDLGNGAYDLDWHTTNYSEDVTFDYGYAQGAIAPEVPSVIIEGVRPSVRGVVPGSGTYYFYVRACYRDQQDVKFCSTWTVSTPVSMVRPLQPPLDFQLGVNNGTGEITLSWSPHPDNPTAVGYEIYRAAGTGTFLPDPPSILAPTTTTTRTPGNGLWTYQIRACVETNCSVFATAPQVQINVPTPVTPPAPTVVSTEGLTATLAWNYTWPSAPGTFQLLYRKSGSTDPGSVAQGISANTASVTVSSAGTWLFSLKACTSNSSSVCSAAGPEVPTLIAEVQVLPPSSVTVGQNQHYSSVKVDWVRGDQRNEPLPPGAMFKLEYRLESATDWTISPEYGHYSVSSMGVTVPGPGSYRFGVRQCSDTGCSARTESGVINVRDGTPAAASAPVMAALPAQPFSNIVPEALPGSFGVDTAGNATYTLPIEVPPGKGGLTPQLAITYNSSGQDGPLGKGFSITGLSSISRCRRTQEGGDELGPGSGLHLGGISHASTIQFCLDGERLVLVSGSHGELGAVYRTEIDRNRFVSIAEVVAVEGGGTVPKRFAIRNADGSSAVYGGEGATNGTLGNTLGWSISSVTDPSGNAISFIYTNDLVSMSLVQGIRHRLAAVEYVGGRLSVEWTDYNENEPNPYRRVSRRGMRPSYYSSSTFVEEGRIERIRVFGAVGEVLHNYLLDYKVLPGDSRRSLLSSIKLCAAPQGATMCTRNTTFQWASDETELGVASQSSSGTFPREVKAWRFGDWDGNGSTDLLFMDEQRELFRGYFGVNLNGGFQFVSESLGWQINVPENSGYENFWVYDLNGDGRDEVIALNAENGKQYWVGLSGASFVDLDENVQSDRLDTKADSNGVRSAFGDLNADGLPDLFWFYNSGSGTNNWVSYAKAIEGEGIKFAQPVEFTSAVVVKRKAYHNRMPVGVFDYNGDGRVDLYVDHGSSSEQPVGDGENGAEGAGASRSEDYDEAAILSPFGTHLRLEVNFLFAGPATGAIRLPVGGVRIVDIGGDGLPELISQRANTRDKSPRFDMGRPGALPIGLCVFDPNAADCPDVDDDYFFSDYDGDGDADLIFGEGNGGARRFRVRQWTGREFSSIAFDTPFPAKDDWNELFVDFDGDGRVDHLRIGKDGVDFRATRLASPHRVRTAIVGVEDGLGRNTEVEYAPLTHSDVYRRDASRFPTHLGRSGLPALDLLAPIWVVKRVSQNAPTSDHPANRVSTRYRYAGLKVQLGGRGSLGFRFMETLDEQRRIQTRTEFRQDFPFIGQAQRTIRTLLPNTSSWPEVCQVSSSSADQFPCRKSCETFDGNGLCTDFDAVPVGSKDLEVTTVTPAQRLSLSMPGIVPAANGNWPRQTWTASTTTVQFDPDTNCPGQERQCAQRKRARTEVSVMPEDVDSYGNVERTTERLFQHTASGQPETLVRQVVTDASFENRDDARWQLGLPRMRVVTTQRGNSTEQRLGTVGYDPQRPLPVVESQEGEYASNQPDLDLEFTLHTFHFYDQAGNRIRSVTCSNHAELMGDDAALCKSAGETAGPAEPVKSTQSPELWVHRYTRSEMDSSGRFVDRSYAPFDGAPDSGGLVSQVVERDSWGRPTRVVDANGVDTRTSYTLLGSVYGTVTSQGMATSSRVELCVNENCPGDLGDMHRVVITETAGSPSQWIYIDAAGRERLTVSEALPARLSPELPAPTVPQYVAKRTEYDSYGRMWKVSQPYFTHPPGGESVGQPTQGQPSEAVTIYDDLDRVVVQQQPNTGVHNHDYAWFSTTVTLPPNVNGLRQHRTQTVNALGEVVSSVDAAGLAINYAYRPTGLLKSMTRGAVTTTMDYDLIGRKTAMTDPDMGSWAYRYNAVGELIEQRALAAGSTPETCTRQSYDALARMRVRSDFADGCEGTPYQTSTWTYDSAAHGIGQLASEASYQDGYGTVGSPSGTELVRRDFQFDSYARSTGVETQIDGRVYRRRVVLDQYSRPFQTFFHAVTDGLPETGQYHEYDPASRLPRAVRDAGDGTQGLVYSWTGNTDAYGNSTFELRGANRARWVSENRSYIPSTGLVQSINTDSGQLQNLELDWDLVGNLRQRHDRGTEGRNVLETYAYDAQQRLTQVRSDLGITIQSFDYLANGNIASRSRSGVADAYQYGPGGGCHAGPHAVRQTAAGSYCYDAHGNQLSSHEGASTTRHIGYTPFHLPGEIVSERLQHQARVAFRYGPNRERLRRTDFIGTSMIADEVTYDLGGGTEIHVRGTAVEARQHLGGVVIIQTPQHLRREYHWFDHLGSVSAVTDSAGFLKGQGELGYDAFGARRDADTGTTLGLLAQWQFNTRNTTRHGYTGHEQIDSTGLIHMNGRIYDPNLARFVQADPFIQDPYDTQSLNRYSYLRNNPLNATDPTGYFVEGLFALAMNWGHHYGGATLDYLSGRVNLGSVGGDSAASFNSAFAWAPRYSVDEVAGTNYRERTTRLGGAYMVERWRTDLDSYFFASNHGRKYDRLVALSMPSEFYGYNIGFTPIDYYWCNFCDTDLWHSRPDGPPDDGASSLVSPLEIAAEIYSGRVVGRLTGAGRSGVDDAARAASVRMGTPGLNGPGAFLEVNERMSARAAAYQVHATGTAQGQAYVVNGIRFDGYGDNLLLEAKGYYSQFVKDGEFRGWWGGADGFVDQARRQIRAAAGAPIQWRFREEAVANATRALFASRNIRGIDVVHFP